MSSERRGEAFFKKAADVTPARYDEETLATNYNALTGERGYHNISVCIHFEYMYKHGGGKGRADNNRKRVI